MVDQAVLASGKLAMQLVLGGLLHPAIGAGPELLAHVRSLGLDLSGPLLLAALEVDAARRADALRSMAAALADDPALLAELDGCIVLLLRGADPVALRDRLAALLGEAADARFLGAVAPAASAQGLAGCHAKLRRCLALMRSLGRTRGVAVEAEFAPYALLFGQPDGAAVAQFVSATIGPLLEQSARRGVPLAETLLAYLDRGHSATAAAAGLGVHVNTVMNRVEVASALLGDWQRANRSAEVHLALRLWKLREGGVTAAAQSARCS